MAELFCPFEASTSPFAERVQQGSLEWSRRFALFTPAAERTFSAGRFGHLAALTFPYADSIVLQLIADWTSWLFAFDDRCDRRDEGKEPHLLQAYADSFISVLGGSDPWNSPNDLILGLFDLRTRLTALSTPAWMNRFTHSALEYFEGCVWESRNRAQGSIPSVRTYKTMRRFAGAVHSYLDFVELAGGFYLPAHLRKDPDVQRLAQATNNVACWTNDVYSAEQELRNGDIHNLVVVLMNEEGLSYPEAFTQAFQECNREVRLFVDLQQHVLRRLAQETVIQRFCASLRAIMRGNLDWCLATSRYATLAQLGGGLPVASNPPAATGFLAESTAKR